MVPYVLAVARQPGFDISGVIIAQVFEYATTHMGSLFGQLVLISVIGYHLITFVSFVLLRLLVILFPKTSAPSFVLRLRL